MTTRKRIIFAVVAILLATGVPLLMLLGVDLYLHRKVERYAGVNIWGYRGPHVGKKRPSEHRLVVIGGSTAFGYGVTWDQAYPAQLEAALRPWSRDGTPVSVVNLGFNAQGAYAFRYVLEDYLWMKYDAAILYEGYNDLGDAINYVVPRRDSPIFRLTGYYPIFPVFFREKAMLLRSGGNLEDAYWGRTVFKPHLAARTTAGVLEAGAQVGESLSRQLDRFAQSTAIRGDAVRVSDVGCPVLFQFHCGSVHDAVTYALSQGKKVLVVTQPYANQQHRDQQAALRAMLASRFGGNANVGYVNLGSVIDLKNPQLAYDGLHLRPNANAIVASHLVRPVVELMPDAFAAPSSGAVRSASSTQ